MIQFSYKYIDVIILILDQRLELCKSSPEDTEPVKGQIIVSLMTKDEPTIGNPLAIVGPSGDVQGPSAEDIIEGSDILPGGWEERKTNNGRSYFVNHVTKSTQWDRPPSTTQVHSYNNNIDELPTAPAGPSRVKSSQKSPNQNRSIQEFGTENVGISCGTTPCLSNLPGNNSSRYEYFILF